MNLSSIAKIIENELNITNGVISQCLLTDIPLIDEIINYLSLNKGKQIRPILVILCGKLLKDIHAHMHTCSLSNENTDKSHNPTINNLDIEEICTHAAVIELIHSASLLHDDVIDIAEIRRNQPTVNKLWGNQESILVGDYLYSGAFSLLTKTKNLQVIELISKTTNEMAKGEMLQLAYTNEPKFIEANYFEIITKKTAKLFEASCKISTTATFNLKENGASPLVNLISDSVSYLSKLTTALGKFGLHLGIAFQLLDDIFDYIESKGSQKQESPEKILATTTGKNFGIDLREGKATLPLIHAYNNSSELNKKIIEKALKNNDLDNFKKVKNIIVSTDSIAYTQTQVKHYVNLATKELEEIPEIQNSKYKDALVNLANFIANRGY